jgi:glycosyltransferase involved in cell wall biosynthesis
VKLPVLLVAFNRPELVKKRLNEFSELEIPNLYITVDGGKDDQGKKVTAEINKIIEEFENRIPIKKRIRESNVGLAKNVTEGINWVLNDYEDCLIIEDDISINKFFYYSAREMWIRNRNKFATIGGFGSLGIPKLLTYLPTPNMWRVTPYFSAWGWVVSRETWELYNLKITKEDMDNYLPKSRLWNQLSAYQKSKFLKRFNRVEENPMFTWDFQMQFLCFRWDLENLLPIIRVNENEGFNDSRSSNTKTRPPRWILGKSMNKGLFSTRLTPKYIGQLLQIIDRNTWVGLKKPFKEIFANLKIGGFFN